MKTAKRIVGSLAAAALATSMVCAAPIAAQAAPTASEANAVATAGSTYTAMATNKTKFSKTFKALKKHIIDADNDGPTLADNTKTYSTVAYHKADKSSTEFVYVDAPDENAISVIYKRGKYTAMAVISEKYSEKTCSFVGYKKTTRTKIITVKKKSYKTPSKYTWSSSKTTNKQLNNRIDCAMVDLASLIDDLGYTIGNLGFTSVKVK